MNWKELVKNIQIPQKDLNYTFNPPVSLNTLEFLKTPFAFSKLPQTLEELYLQTNGICENLEDMPIGYLIWPIERTIETNTEVRTQPYFTEIYQSFDQWLFFSDAGNGDMFGFLNTQGKFETSNIFRWDHEDDSRTKVAPDLQTFIEQTLTDAI